MRDSLEKTEIEISEIPIDALTIDLKALEQKGKILFSDKNIRNNALDDNRTILMKKAHWQEYSQEYWGNEKRVPLVEFLKQHRTVETNRIHDKKVFDRRWKENMSWSTPQEREFLKTSRMVLPDSWVEVLQMTSFKNGNVLNKSLALGGGEYIYKSEIDTAVKDLDLKSQMPDTVFIVHNHFDEYADLSLPINAEQKDGLAIVGGLSKDDIEMADNLLKNEMNGVGKVVIAAINERGITYSYMAGTSETRDWMNEK